MNLFGSYSLLVYSFRILFAVHLLSFSLDFFTSLLREIKLTYIAAFVFCSLSLTFHSLNLNCLYSLFRLSFVCHAFIIFFKILTLIAFLPILLSFPFFRSVVFPLRFIVISYRSYYHRIYIASESPKKAICRCYFKSNLV